MRMIGGCPVLNKFEDRVTYPHIIHCIGGVDIRVNWCLDNIDADKWCYDPYIVEGYDFMFKCTWDAITFKLTFGGRTIILNHD